MDDLKELLNKTLHAVEADDPYGRTSEELIAEKLLEDAIAGRGESRKLLKQYQAELSPVLHSALDKKIQHAVK